MKRLLTPEEVKLVNGAGIEDLRAADLYFLNNLVKTIQAKYDAMVTTTLTVQEKYLMVLHITNDIYQSMSADEKLMFDRVKEYLQFDEALRNIAGAPQWFQLGR